jgi:transcription-repair coupling factor (superfamily II helicase)
LHAGRDPHDALSMSSATIEELAAVVADGPVAAYGLSDAVAAYAVARLGAPLVVVTPDEGSAARLARDIEFFLAADAAGDEPAAAPPVLSIPAIDTSAYAELSPDRGALTARMTALFRLAHGGSLASGLLVVSAHSLVRKTVARDQLEALTFVIAVGDGLDRDATAARLVSAGYTRVPVVEDPGTFAVRGMVLDLFPPLYRYPVRVELFGDEVDAMRLFDPRTQRTLRAIDAVYLHPVRETIKTAGAEPRARILDAADRAAHPSAQTRRVLESIEAGEEFVGIETLTPAFHARMASLFEYLPTGSTARWLILDPEAVRAAARDELELAEQRYQERLADHRIAFPVASFYLGADQLEAALDALPHRIEARRIEYADEPLRVLRFEVDDNLALRGALERARHHKADELMAPLVEALAGWRAEGWRVLVACDSGKRADQLAGLLEAHGITLARSRPGSFSLEAAAPGGAPVVVRGRLGHGFAFPAERLALLTDDDIFGERVRSSARQQAAARRARDALLGGVADFSELAAGDYLVHDLHGVGTYRGLVKLPLKGIDLDFLQLDYDGGTLYLPVYRLNEVQRYVGVEGREPRIDKLGGQTWDKTRRKVSRDVRAMAEGLLQLYAQRQALPGHAFPPADPMFREFEATFEFEETPDQQKAIDDVLADMERARPMDRLVCGDVGYGKTEVAIRAALRAVLGGKQVVVLAPTTVLVEQHWINFRRRFAGWPVRVERLSRFQSRKDQLAAIKAIAAGQLDVVVGTHRLLSKDVRFSDLGLVIVDEEQRFGVAHKERLKKLRSQVDSLTLTATPIPRTLHMAMVGLRDLSIIATPPADRRSIRTFVARPDDGVLREAIERELARGGQVFFVCRRIGGRGGDDRGPLYRERAVDDWARHLRELVPAARVAVAHGQMQADELERVMIGFVDHLYDVLVSTTIIENGLDIPRANTMFIDRADAFGLSQLYQLRGRIGRSSRRAFCYLLAPAAEKLTDEAKRRLEVLQRFSDLGAGFQIASHDLELRGAGDLLGGRQSGMISAVGFDQYTRILEDAVAELRGEAIHRVRDPELTTDVPGFLPDDYVPDTGQRLDLYKRLSGAEDDDELAALADEIADRYGPLPAEVRLLAELMAVKLYARRAGATAVDLAGDRLSLTLGAAPPLAPAAIAELVAARGSRFRLTPDMRLQRVFTAEERQDPVAAARAGLLEILDYAT